MYSPFVFSFPSSAVAWCGKLNAIACASETCARIPRLVVSRAFILVDCYMRESCISYLVVADVINIIAAVSCYTGSCKFPGISVNFSLVQVSCQSLSM